MTELEQAIAAVKSDVAATAVLEAAELARDWGDVK